MCYDFIIGKGDSVKRIKMLGFAFVLMFASVFSVSAADDLGVMPTFSEKIIDGKITYEDKSGLGFYYQFVKIKESSFASISADVEVIINKMTTDVEAYDEAASEMESKKEILDAIDPSDTTAYEAALKEYEDAEDAADAILANVVKDLEDYMAKVSTVANYDNTKWINVNGGNSGTINVDTTDFAADDMYILWIKSDVLSGINGGIFADSIYTNDGVISVPSIDSTTDDDKANVSVKKDAGIKNPKTGVDLPIVFGALIVIVASVCIYVIRKNSLFKQV